MDVGSGRLVVVSFIHASVHETSSSVRTKVALLGGGSVVSHRNEIRIMMKIKSIVCFGFIFLPVFIRLWRRLNLFSI